MKKMPLLFAVLVSIMLAVIPSAAAADTPIGRVAALRGSVTALNGGQSRSLRTSGPVFEQDTIRTDARSRVQIIFTDNTIITLGVSSELTISRYVWDREKKTGAMTSEIPEGVFRVLGGAITGHAPENFITRTPVATIGIRGSMYKGRFRDNSLSVLFEGGTGIDISSSAGSVALLRPGYGTLVAGPDARPSAARRFTASQIESIDRELGPQASAGPKPKKSAAAHPSSDQTDDTRDRSSQKDRKKKPLTDMTVLRSGPIPRTVVVDRPDPEIQTVIPLSGWYKSLLADDTGRVSIYSYGPSHGLNRDGRVLGEIELDTGITRPFDYPIPDFGKSTGYEGFTFSETGRELALLDDFFTLPSIVLSSPLGEFSIFSIPFGFLGPSDRPLGFTDLGFAGIPATAVPENGIDRYAGLVMAVGTLLRPETGRSLEFANVACEINWHAGTYMAHLFAGDGDDEFGKGPVIFGHLNGTQFADLYTAGPGMPPKDDMANGPGVIDWLSGDLEFGEFYGRTGQGFGLTGNITVISIQDQTQVLDTLDFILAGMRETSPEPEDRFSPSGIARFKGFVTGLSENMADPGTDRSLFMNRSPDAVTITLDRDRGTVTGQINAADVLGHAGDLHLTIGPDGQSAYVLDDHFAACLGSGQGEPGDITDLKPYGNYLITAAPAGDDDIPESTPEPGHQFSEHLQWGYWEAAYQDPVTEMDHHIHIPGTFWIAGQPAPEEAVNRLIRTGFTGTYSGMAEGISIDEGRVSPLAGGYTRLAIDFSPSAVHPVSGTIGFDSVSLNVLGTLPVSAGGFTAGIEGAPDGLNGAFFGPDADAVGGNFNGFKDHVRYIGIFGATLQ